MNVRLSAAQTQLRPLNIQNMTFQCVFLHLGPGTYTHQIDPGIHRHPELHLEFVLDGEFDFRLRNKPIKLKKGTGLLIPPNTPHTWSCKGRGAMMGSIIEISGQHKGHFLKQLDPEHCPKNNGFQSTEIDHTMSKLFTCLCVNDKRLWASQKLALLIELWLLECLSTQFKRLDLKPVQRKVKEIPRERSRDIAENMMAFLETNYMYPINLENTILSLGMSSRHANRIFKKYYNETISQSLARIRLDRALKELQNNPVAPIKSIAYNTGFSSTSYFTRCFKQAFGMLPKTVRKGQAPKSDRKLKTI